MPLKVALGSYDKYNITLLSNINISVEFIKRVEKRIKCEACTHVRYFIYRVVSSYILPYTKIISKKNCQNHHRQKYSSSLQNICKKTISVLQDGS